jgi:hypothetical protein
MTSTVILQQIQARQAHDPFLSTTLAERITELKEDPLVLACVRKAYEISSKGYVSLDDQSLIGLITDQDRELAEKIREYYTKKFFWRALSEVRPLSDYRRRLINLLKNRIRNCKDQDCGIYYKLPYFYEEDVVYEEFKKTLKTDSIDSLGSSRQNTMLKSLEFLKTSSVRQRKCKQIRYWFKDDNNFLYSIELTSDNPLLPIFDDYIKDRPTVLFETRISEDRIDNMHFYKLYSYKFVKEQNA